MNTFTAESLAPITHNQIPVITTELLARLYGTLSQRITAAHHRNKLRFIEGKHYFIAKGKILDALKISLRDFQTLAPNVHKLILWTERGAARHAKMLETEQAWEVFEKLEDCYFNQTRHQPAERPQIPFSEDFDARALMYLRHGIPVATLPLHPEQMIISKDSVIELLKESGYFVIKRDELINRLDAL